MTKPSIQIEGAKEVRRSLKHLGDKRVPDGFKRVNKSAAELVAEAASQVVPVRSGSLKQSIRALGQQAGATVKMGKAKTPYAGWIEFGGTIRRGLVTRPFVKAGRYLFPTVERLRGKVEDMYLRELNKLLKEFT